MMTSLVSPEVEWPQLVGRREPEHLSVFDGSDRLGHNALTLASRIGTPPMPWQIDNVLAILRTNDDGTWTHPDACIICPRQNGKSEILLLICLYGLFVRGENIVFSTQQWKTARKLAIRFRAMIKARPDLWNRLASPPTLSQGQSIVTLKSGPELMFVTRSGDTGHGLDKVDRVIYDEAYNLTEAEMSGPTLAQMAAPNPQTIYTSSAVNAQEHQNGQVLAGIRRNGHHKARGLYFAEYMAPEPPNDMPKGERKRLREDPATAKLANPSYGVIQTDAKVAKAMLSFGGTAIGRRTVEVDLLGWGDWPVDESEVISPIPETVWSDMRNPAVVLTGARTIAVHRSRNRHLWSIVAAQWSSDGRAHIEVGPPRSGHHTEIAEYLIAKVADWNPSALVIDRKNSAAVLEPLMIEAGIEPVMMGTPEIAHASGGFLDAALAGKLSHSDQEIFNDAIASASMRELPGGDFAWAEDDNGVAGPLVGASQAHWALLKFGAKPKRPPAKPQGGARQKAPRSRETNVMEMAF